jgi:hypothetical protein
MQRFTVKKENGQLIFNDFGGFQSRNPSTIWCIQEADKIYNWKDFKQITINTGDKESNINEYTYSKHYSYNNTVPDFNFHSWPESGIKNYTEFTNDISNAGLDNFIINKVGWIGNINTNPNRRILLEIGKKHNDILDIIDMSWKKSDKIELNYSKYISTPDLAKTYSILIDIEGNGYSGRLKHLLWSHRPVLLVDRPHKEYFFEFLKEWKHYIPVERDLSDLIEKTKWCINNYDKAKQIAENAYDFSKQYLTRQACYKQWDKVIDSLQCSSSQRNQ